MVCSRQPISFVMSTAHNREVVSICSRSQARMQIVGDLLLLTSDIRPVTTESLSVFGGSYSMCRETIITRTKGLLVMTGRIMEQVHGQLPKWQDVCTCLQDLCELVIGLTECCAHAAYMMAVSKLDCVPAVTGIIDKYKISRADMEVELCCQQLKQSTCEELSPPLMVEICSDINKNLTVMTECCKYASERAYDSSHQDQFKLCIKSFTSCASCLLASIRSFKTSPSELLHKRCAAFSDSLVAATKATVNFATEDRFTGRPAHLTQEAVESKKSVLGACLGIVCSCIQLCRAVQELAYDNKNLVQKHRISVCTESIQRSSSQLTQTLLQNNVIESRVPSSASKKQTRHVLRQ